MRLTGFLCLALLCLSPHARAAATPVPAAVAIAAAQRTAAALGLATTSEAKAAATVGLRGRPEWQVKYKDQALFLLNAAGRVYGFVDLRALSAVQRTEGRPLVPEAAAVAAATKVLRAFDGGPNLQFAGARLDSPEDGVDGWLVTWNQLYRGLPYDATADVAITVDGLSGTPKAGRVPEVPPAPASTTVAITEGDATQTALAHVAKLVGSVETPLVSARLEIAQPTRCWSAPEVAATSDDPWVLVWSVWVYEPRPQAETSDGMSPNRLIGYVQVAANTGAVVGDAPALGRGPARPPRAPVASGKGPKAGAPSEQKPAPPGNAKQETSPK